jgi:hypothetical protein
MAPSPVVPYAETPLVEEDAMDLLETMDGPTGQMAAALRLRIPLDGLDHAVPPEMLGRFASGSATKAERRTVIRHLLKGCPSCSRRLARSFALDQPEEPEDLYDEAFERSLDRALDVLTRLQQA